MTQAEHIRARMDAIRITDKDLAVRAGIHKDTLAKTLAGRCDTRLSTLHKIEAALAAAERELLDHLTHLHARQVPGSGAESPQADALPPEGAAGGDPRPSFPRGRGEDDGAPAPIRSGGCAALSFGGAV